MWIMISSVAYMLAMAGATVAIYRHEAWYPTGTHVPTAKKWAMLTWQLVLSLAGAGVATAIILHIENKKIGVFILFGILFLTMIGQMVALTLGRGAAQRRS